jgi:hypothetical protein
MYKQGDYGKLPILFMALLFRNFIERKVRFMLTPELIKLKDRLEGKTVKLDEAKLLAELKKLDIIDIEFLHESLSLSGRVCKTCGKLL